MRRRHAGPHPLPAAAAAGRAIAALLTLAACQPLPHPFADTHEPARAPILAVADAVGVVVEPVEGAPAATGAGLAQAMAKALQDLDVPASVSHGNRYSYHLLGAAAARPDPAGPTAVRLSWSLRSADGKEIGSDIEDAAIPIAQWIGGSGPALTRLAAREAPRLGRFIEDAVSVEHKPARRVFVRPVEGAPGDGGDALPRALVFLLHQRGVALAADAKDAITVAGTVTVTPVPPDQEHVRIAWQVLDPDGSAQGRIVQENTIPRGSIEGAWGDIAMAIDAAAVDDLVRLIESVPPAS